MKTEQQMQLSSSTALRSCNSSSSTSASCSFPTLFSAVTNRHLTTTVANGTNNRANSRSGGKEDGSPRSLFVRMAVTVGFVAVFIFGTHPLQPSSTSLILPSPQKSLSSCLNTSTMTTTDGNTPLVSIVSNGNTTKNNIIQFAAAQSYVKKRVSYKVAVKTNSRGDVLSISGGIPAGAKLVGGGSAGGAGGPQPGIPPPIANGPLPAEMRAEMAKQRAEQNKLKELGGPSIRRVDLPRADLKLPPMDCPLSDMVKLMTVVDRRGDVLAKESTVKASKAVLPASAVVVEEEKSDAIIAAEEVITAPAAPSHSQLVIMPAQLMDLDSNSTTNATLLPFSTTGAAVTTAAATTTPTTAAAHKDKQPTAAAGGGVPTTEDGGDGDGGGGSTTTAAPTTAAAAAASSARKLLSSLLVADEGAVGATPKGSYAPSPYTAAEAADGRHPLLWGAGSTAHSYQLPADDGICGFEPLAPYGLSFDKYIKGPSPSTPTAPTAALANRTILLLGDSVLRNQLAGLVALACNPFLYFNCSHKYFHFFNVGAGDGGRSAGAGGEGGEAYGSSEFPNGPLQCFLNGTEPTAATTASGGGTQRRIDPLSSSPIANQCGQRLRIRNIVMEGVTHSKVSFTKAEKRYDWHKSLPPPLTEVTFVETNTRFVMVQCHCNRKANIGAFLGNLARSKRVWPRRWRGHIDMIIANGGLHCAKKFLVPFYKAIPDGMATLRAVTNGFDGRPTELVYFENILSTIVRDPTHSQVDEDFLFKHAFVAEGIVKEAQGHMFPARYFTVPHEGTAGTAIGGGASGDDGGADSAQRHKEGHNRAPPSSITTCHYNDPMHPAAPCVATLGAALFEGLRYVLSKRSIVSYEAEGVVGGLQQQLGGGGGGGEGEDQQSGSLSRGGSADDADDGDSSAEIIPVIGFLRVERSHGKRSSASFGSASTAGTADATTGGAGDGASMIPSGYSLSAVMSSKDAVINVLLVLLGVTTTLVVVMAVGSYKQRASNKGRQ